MRTHLNATLLGVVILVSQSAWQACQSPPPRQPAPVPPAAQAPQVVPAVEPASNPAVSTATSGCAPAGTTASDPDRFSSPLRQTLFPDSAGTPFLDLFGNSLAPAETASGDNPSEAAWRQPQVVQTGPCCVYVFTDASYCAPCRQLEPQLHSVLWSLIRRGWLVRFGYDPPPFAHIRVYDRIGTGTPGYTLMEHFGVESVPTIIAVDDCGDVVRMWDPSQPFTVATVESLVYGSPHASVRPATEALVRASAGMTARVVYRPQP